MDTIDENEVPKQQQSDPKRIMNTMAINLGIMLLVGLLSKLTNADNEGGVVLYAFWILIQAVLCMLAGIIVTVASPKLRPIGIGLLLSVVLTMLIGFGTCMALFAN